MKDHPSAASSSQTDINLRWRACEARSAEASVCVRVCRESE